MASTATQPRPAIQASAQMCPPRPTTQPATWRAGIPARQVAGWVVGLGGHIWAEAWIAGRGWVAVDATAPWIGVPGNYLPLMTSTDGRLSVFHLAWPRIQRLD